MVNAEDARRAHLPEAQDVIRRTLMPLRPRFGRRPAFDPHQHPRKLNVGCGYDKREGYLNVDLHGFHDPDLIADARDLQMLPGDFYEELVAQDVLEHLKREDIHRALREWNRVLVIGGRIHIRTSDLISLGRWLTDSNDPERHRLVVHLTFGTQAYEGDYHLCGFTELLLRDYLSSSGFDQITFGPLYDDWLLQVEAVKFRQAVGGARR
jgi:predicted SAM-dependent methyltransferase